MITKTAQRVQLKPWPSRLPLLYGCCFSEFSIWIENTTVIMTDNKGRQVLEEDAYLDAMDKIIERDFFPGVQRDNASAAPPLSLDEFHTKFTSEDNQSFEKIMVWCAVALHDV